MSLAHRASGTAAVESLRIDADYRNTSNWRHGADRFNAFFRFPDGGINNVAGFRPKSRAGASTDICDSAFVVLVTNFTESEWPDRLDREEGLLFYYGDNRQPGTALAETPVGGNRLLEKVFNELHAGSRRLIQPFLVFQAIKKSGDSYMRFLGLAAPGAAGMSALDDLVAAWRVQGQTRFQNYRASFTILSEESVRREWLEDLVTGKQSTESLSCPQAWRHWVETGRYSPLKSVRARQPRTKAEQLPANDVESQVLEQLSHHLNDREFEFAALELIQLMDSRFVNLEVTPPKRDGGRDIIGDYRVGHDLHEVLIKAAVEAKRWRVAGSVGVKPVARLVSRLRRRDLGVFITTSFFDRQVQLELIEDDHPVLLVSGGDIARLLIAKDLATTEGLSSWLNAVKTRAASAVESRTQESLGP